MSNSRSAKGVVRLVGYPERAFSRYDIRVDAHEIQSTEQPPELDLHAAIHHYLKHRDRLVFLQDATQRGDVVAHRASISVRLKPDDSPTSVERSANTMVNYFYSLNETEEFHCKKRLLHGYLRVLCPGDYRNKSHWKIYEFFRTMRCVRIEKQ